MSSRHPLHLVSLSSVVAAVALAMLAPSPAHADPLPGEQLKFSQLPINNLVVNNVTYQGHDEVSTAYAHHDATGNIDEWQGTFMADDFADKFSTPVVHLSWWGSYLTPAGVPLSQVKQFLVSFETDVPQGPNGQFSHPGSPILSQVVTVGALSPASGTFTEQLVTGNIPEPLFKYNAELAVPFPEQPNTVYWLKIVALTDDSNLVWGWHDRDYTVNDALASTGPAVVPGEVNLSAGNIPVWHFQDDAVSGRLNVFPAPGTILLGVQQDPATYQPHNYIDITDGPQGIGTFSKDLAFQLYTTVPEPSVAATCALLAALTPALRRRTTPRS